MYQRDQEQSEWPRKKKASGGSERYIEESRVRLIDRPRGTGPD